jgi:hypothetical protein
MGLIVIPRLGADVAFLQELLNLKWAVPGFGWGHCATGLHKFGARYPVPLKTNADDESRIGCSQAQALRVMSEMANPSTRQEG